MQFTRQLIWIHPFSAIGRPCYTRPRSTSTASSALLSQSLLAFLAVSSPGFVTPHAGSSSSSCIPLSGKSSLPSSVLPFPKGPYINDVSEIVGILDPFPPRQCQIHATSLPLVRNWLPPFPPHSTYIIYVWPIMLKQILIDHERTCIASQIFVLT